MWTTFTEKQINVIARQLFLPLILLVNYTLLQYLLACYWERRHEPCIVLLFVTDLVGVPSIIPFASPDNELFMGLNDASESCCVVTFLLQITVIGHDLNIKFKLRLVMVLTCVAELLIVADLAMVVPLFVVTFVPGVMSQKLAEDTPNAFENLTVVFILFFRFYYIGLSRGWRFVFRTKKTEVLYYALFASHEVPFMLFNSARGLSWEYEQAIYMLLTIAGCLFLTARSKVKSLSRYTTSRVSVGGCSEGSVPKKRLSMADIAARRQSLEVVNVPKIVD